VTTRIEIDSDLLAAAMSATRLPTERATVEEGLRLLVRLRGQAEAFDDLAGLGWDGDHSAMRESRRLDRHE